MSQRAGQVKLGAGMPVLALSGLVAGASVCSVAGRWRKKGHPRLVKSPRATEPGLVATQSNGKGLPLKLSGKAGLEKGSSSSTAVAKGNC